MGILGIEVAHWLLAEHGGAMGILGILVICLSAALFIAMGFVAIALWASRCIANWLRG